MGNKEQRREQRQQYMFVIRELTKREIRRKYSRSYFGIFWSVLNPLLSMIVLSLIFTQLFRRSIENFPIYYLTGYILWQMFTGATNAAMTTLVDNKPMLLKVKFPMQIFILARVYTALVNLGYSFTAYAVMLAFFRIPLHASVLFLPVIIGGLLLFSLGMSYVLAAAYVFFGDVKHLYSVVLTLWMYCSAIFYPAENLTGPIRAVIECNPLYQFIDGARSVVMQGELPGAAEMAAMAVWSVAVFLGGQFVFGRSRNRIMVKL